MLRSWIACRPASYAPFGYLAYDHLAGLGIRFVEIPVEAARAVAAELGRRNLQISSLQGEFDVARDDVPGQLKPQLQTCNLFGVRLLFLSVKAGHTPLEPCTTACEPPAIWRPARASRSRLKPTPT